MNGIRQKAIDRYSQKKEELLYRYDIALDIILTIVSSFVIILLGYPIVIFDIGNPEGNEFSHQAYYTLGLVASFCFVSFYFFVLFLSKKLKYYSGDLGIYENKNINRKNQ